MYLWPEEPDIPALYEAVAKAGQRASQQDGPKESRLVQVLCYAKLLHIILAQGLLRQRVQDLQHKALSVTHQEKVTHII